MSVPFADSNAANDAVQAFFSDIEDARKKHRIADVAVIVEVVIMVDDQETRGGLSMYLGSSANKLPLLAREYGAARQEHEEVIALLVKSGRKAAGAK